MGAWVKVAVVVLGASLLAMRELFGMMNPGEAGAGDRKASLVLGALACSALYWLHPMALGVSARTMSLAGLGPLVAMVFAIIAPALYFLFRFGNQQTVAPRMVATQAMSSMRMTTAPPSGPKSRLASARNVISRPA